MATEDEWKKRFWQWCERLIPNDPDFREYAQVEIVSEKCVSLTFYSAHERFQLTAAGPHEAIPEGVLQLFMTDNREPLRGQMYIGPNNRLGFLDGEFNEETFDNFLEHLHERTPFFRRKFVRLRELDALRRKLGL